LLFAVDIELLIKALGWICAALVLGLCLFGTAPVFLSNNFLSPIFREVLAVIHDPQTQCLIVLCACFGFVTFTLLQPRSEMTPFWRLNAQESCLAAFLLLGVFSYIIIFPVSTQSTQLLLLCVGAALGKGAGVWASWWREYSTARGVNVTIVILFILMLVFSFLWYPVPVNIFQYRGRARWSGLWNTPNTFGLLMGTGMILATGQLIQSLMSKIQSQKLEGREWKTELIRWLKVVFFMAVALSLSIGLMKSYSRGAWLAAICGLAYLSWWGIQSPKSKVRSRWTLWLRKNRFPLSTILIAAIILCFWQFKQTDRAIVRRAVSVGNMNDFSWRNRVSAWEGALQIMAEHPWLGAGWNLPERTYDSYYRQVKVDEAAAIQLNDYLMLGATLGIPALFCFGMYIWLCLGDGRWKATSRGQKSEIGNHDLKSDFRFPISDVLSMTCRAGAIVLLVGFWFDGGLFKLPTAAIFWILLELGSVGNHEIHKAHEND
jgi:O-antigen ligase